MKFRSTKEINVLPREILVLIFSFLHHADVCTAAMVCKAWRDVARTRSLWKTMSVFNEGTDRRISPPTRALFRRYIGYSLECLFIHVIDNMFLKYIQKSCPKLRMLVLRGTDYKHCDFRLLPSSLHYLEISICDPDFEEHYPPDWYKSFNNNYFPLLLCLKITQAPNCSEAIMQIATLDSVSDLFIGWVDYQISEESFNELMTMTQLEELELVAVEQIPEDYAHKIVKNLTDLKMLSFLDAEQLVTHSDVCTLAKLPNLETLKLSSRKRIMKGVIKSIPTMKKLKEVRFDSEVHFAEIPGPKDLVDMLTTMQELRPDVDFFFRDIKVCKENYDCIKNKACVGEESDSDTDDEASDDGNYDDDDDFDSDDFDDDDFDDDDFDDDLSGGEEEGDDDNGNDHEDDETQSNEN